MRWKKTARGCSYQAKKDRDGAESEKEAFSVMIQGNVVELIKTLGGKRLSEDELTAIFNQTWSKWMKNITLVPLKMPNVSKVVEQCITEFYTAQWKEIHRRLNMKEVREWGERLDLEINDLHIKGKTTTFQRMLALIWKNKQTNDDALQRARSHTHTTFKTVSDALVKFSGNFSSQFVTDLLQIVHKRRVIQSKDFEFTDTYEIDMAFVVCGYAIPVFERMAKDFKAKHDPEAFVEGELKPNFRSTFIDMVNDVEYEIIAAQNLCHQLKDPITHYVLENLPSLIFKKMRANLTWTQDKQSFVAKILLEIGGKLDANASDGFQLCTNFLTNAAASMEYWARFFTESYYDSSHLSSMARDEISTIVDFLIDETVKVSKTFSSSEEVNTRVWMKEFHSAIMGRIKVSLVDLNMYMQDRKLPHMEVFTDKIKEGLESFRHQLCQNVRYSETIGRESVHDMLVKKVAGCTEQCPFCGAQCDVTMSNHVSNDIKHKTQHRPQALGSYRWLKDNTPILDVCTYLVSTDCTFRNTITGGEQHPYKDYSTKYKHWHIAADKSFGASLYWKWFIARYSTDIEKHFGFAKTKIPSEWKDLKWRNVKEWLCDEYKM